MTFKLSRISASPRYSDPLKGPHKFRHFRETGPWYSNSWPIFLSSWEFDFEDGFARLQNALRKVAFTIVWNTFDPECVRLCCIQISDARVVTHRDWRNCDTTRLPPMWP